MDDDAATKSPPLEIFIEHCINCHKHEHTTRHFAPHYMSLAENLVESVHLLYPNANVVINSQQHCSELNLKKTDFPRLGAFEVYIRGGTNNQPLQKIYSKLERNRWPIMDKLMAKIEAIGGHPGEEQTKMLLLRKSGINAKMDGYRAKVGNQLAISMFREGDPELNETWSLVTPLMLIRLPHLLIRCKNWTMLERLLTNPIFLWKKLCIVGVEAILEDFALAISTMKGGGDETKAFSATLVHISANLFEKHVIQLDFDRNSMIRKALEEELPMATKFCVQLKRDLFRAMDKLRVMEEDGNVIGAGLAEASVELCCLQRRLQMFNQSGITEITSGVTKGEITRLIDTIQNFLETRLKRNISFGLFCQLLETKWNWFGSVCGNNVQMVDYGCITNKDTEKYALSLLLHLLQPSHVDRCYVKLTFQKEAPYGLKRLSEDCVFRCAMAVGVFKQRFKVMESFNRSDNGGAVVVLKVLEEAANDDNGVAIDAIMIELEKQGSDADSRLRGGGDHELMNLVAVSRTGPAVFVFMEFAIAPDVLIKTNDFGNLLIEDLVMVTQMSPDAFVIVYPFDSYSQQCVVKIRQGFPSRDAPEIVASKMSHKNKEMITLLSKGKVTCYLFSVAYSLGNVMMSKPRESNNLTTLVIASTGDMESERNLINTAFFPALKSLLVTQGIRFDWIDPRLPHSGSLEWQMSDRKYANRGATFFDRCSVKSFVNPEAKVPFGICFLGDRMGWKPPEAEEDPDEADGSSSNSSRHATKNVVPLCWNCGDKSDYHQGMSQCTMFLPGAETVQLQRQVFGITTARAMRKGSSMLAEIAWALLSNSEETDSVIFLRSLASFAESDAWLSNVPESARNGYIEPGSKEIISAVKQYLKDTYTVITWKKNVFNYMPMFQSSKLVLKSDVVAEIVKLEKLVSTLEAEMEIATEQEDWERANNENLYNQKFLEAGKAEKRLQQTKKQLAEMSMVPEGMPLSEWTGSRSYQNMETEWQAAQGVTLSRLDVILNGSLSAVSNIIHTRIPKLSFAVEEQFLQFRNKMWNRVMSASDEEKHWSRKTLETGVVNACSRDDGVGSKIVYVISGHGSGKTHTVARVARLLTASGDCGDNNLVFPILVCGGIDGSLRELLSCLQHWIDALLRKGGVVSSHRQPSTIAEFSPLAVAKIIKQLISTLPSSQNVVLILDGIQGQETLLTLFAGALLDICTKGLTLILTGEHVITPRATRETKESGKWLPAQFITIEIPNLTNDEIPHVVTSVLKPFPNNKTIDIPAIISLIQSITCSAKHLPLFVSTTAKALAQRSLHQHKVVANELIECESLPEIWCEVLAFWEVQYPQIAHHLFPILCALPEGATIEQFQSMLMTFDHIQCRNGDVVSLCESLSLFVLPYASPVFTFGFNSLLTTAQNRYLERPNDVNHSLTEKTVSLTSASEIISRVAIDPSSDAAIVQSNKGLASIHLFDAASSRSWNIQEILHLNVSPIWQNPTEISAVIPSKGVCNLTFDQQDPASKSGSLVSAVSLGDPTLHMDVTAFARFESKIAVAVKRGDKTSDLMLMIATDATKTMRLSHNGRITKMDIGGRGEYVLLVDEMAVYIRLWDFPHEVFYCFPLPAFSIYSLPTRSFCKNFPKLSTFHPKGSVTCTSCWNGQESEGFIYGDNTGMVGGWGFEIQKEKQQKEEEETARRILLFRLPSSYATCCCLSPSENWSVFGLENGLIIIFELASSPMTRYGRMLFKIEVSGLSSIKSVGYSPHGTMLSIVAGHNQGFLHRFSMPPGGARDRKISVDDELAWRPDFSWHKPEAPPLPPKKPPPIQLKIEQILQEEVERRNRLELDQIIAKPWLRTLDTHEQKRLAKEDQEIVDYMNDKERRRKEECKRAAAAKKYRESKGRPPPEYWHFDVIEARKQAVERFRQEERRKIEAEIRAVNEEREKAAKIYRLSVARARASTYREIPVFEDDEEVMMNNSMYNNDNDISSSNDNDNNSFLSDSVTSTMKAGSSIRIKKGRPKTAKK